VYDPLALTTLFKRVGADRIVLGADHPVGGSDPVGEVKKPSRCRTTTCDGCVRRGGAAVAD
jgi:hypothetical protein